MQSYSRTKQKKSSDCNILTLLASRYWRTSPSSLAKLLFQLFLKRLFHEFSLTIKKHSFILASEPFSMIQQHCSIFPFKSKASPHLTNYKTTILAAFSASLALPLLYQLNIIKPPSCIVSIDLQQIFIFIVDKFNLY